jgi:sulfhydrogenase subunit delta
VTRQGGEAVERLGERGRRRPRLAVFKFASCDGCQLQILNLEEALLALAEQVEIAYFLEATSRVAEGPFDVALVEGSVTTRPDVERIRRIREQATLLVALGACATSGGLQALRNHADVGEYARSVYPHPEWIDTLPTSTPLSAHVPVDLELQGCPVNEQQVLGALAVLLLGGRPALPRTSVCMECQRRGQPCVVVTRGLPCLGPITRAGCGALCPSLGRDCYGCFGPAPDANPESLLASFEAGGLSRADAVRRLRSIYNAAPAFAALAERLEGRHGG